MSRLCYKTNELALVGAIAQMAEHEALGDQVSVEQSAVRHQARVQARFNSNQRDCDLMHRLRLQNKEAIAVKELTKEVVYPKSRLSK